MKDGLSRRSFLKHTAAGTAVLSMPSFLAACGSTKQVAVTAPTPGATKAALPANPFDEWFGVDEATMRRALAALTANGADQAELYFQHRKSTSILYQDGIVSQARTSIDQGVGLRCVVGEQTGYAYTEELTEEAMLRAAKLAASIAGTGAAAPPAEFARHALPKNRYEVVVPWGEVGIDRKLPRLRRAAELARALDPAVKKVEINWGDEDSRIMIVDHTGRVLLDRQPMARLRIAITAEKDGVTQAHNANIAARDDIEWFTDEELSTVAKQAVDRTMHLFEARRPPAGEMPVVLAAGASGILLHEAIGHGMEADFNRKGVSIYADMIGRKVAEDFITIVDDGTLEHERGAINVDDEGNPGKRTVLVEDGKLVSYMHDRISAKHYGTEPTGSGRRQSFRHVPMPRMRCTYMEAGPHARDEIIAGAKNGILAETFTNGQVQIGAGDYTFYIKNGWLIEDGKITAPLKDINIIGNGPDTLRKISMVGNDPALDTGGWTCGKNGQSVPVSIGIPTVLVSTLTVGGKNA